MGTFGSLKKLFSYQLIYFFLLTMSNEDNSGIFLKPQTFSPQCHFHHISNYVLVLNSIPVKKTHFSWTHFMYPNAFDNIIYSVHD